MSSEKYWTPSVGDVIGSRYEVTDTFGEGGVVKVWKGVDNQDGKTVAIKHLLFDSENYKIAPNRVEDLFQREIKALRTIKDAGGHPNIVDLYDTASEHGTQFAIVEPVDGKELDEDHLSFSADKARQIVMELADAMGFLHRNEIIYRDLKPDNAMLRSNGSPVLIDFNTAKEMDSDVNADLACPNCGKSVDASDYICPDCNTSFDGGQDTVIGGGNTYKPPEATEEKAQFRQGPWSDVYSLGKILHGLLRDSGKAPGGNGKGPKDWPSDKEKCPRYMHEIIKRATKEDTGERYNNARIFKVVLERRDPEPPVKARLVHLQEGDEWEMEPGDTIGRRGSSGPDATVRIDDPGGKYISSVQVQIDIDNNDNWIIRDESLNGTYVQKGSGWERVLCEKGRKRLSQRGEDPTDRHGNIPPESLPLGREAMIALVDPTYGAAFEFEAII